VKRFSVYFPDIGSQIKKFYKSHSQNRQNISDINKQKKHFSIFSCMYRDNLCSLPVFQILNLKNFDLFTSNALIFSLFYRIKNLTRLFTDLFTHFRYFCFLLCSSFIVFYSKKSTFQKVDILKRFLPSLS